MNLDEVPLAITIASDYGTKTFAEVQPGKSAFGVFPARLGSLPAGHVSVTATSTVDGSAATLSEELPYAARACR